MPLADRPTDRKSEQLAQLARTQGIIIAPEDLEALAKQLRELDELERDQLQDSAPALIMDANWHD